MKSRLNKCSFRIISHPIVGSIPGQGRSPGEGNGNALQYFCLGNPMDRGFLRATVHGVVKSQIQPKRLNNNEGSNSVSSLFSCREELEKLRPGSPLTRCKYSRKAPCPAWRSSPEALHRVPQARRCWGHQRFCCFRGEVRDCTGCSPPCGPWVPHCHWWWACRGL